MTDQPTDHRAEAEKWLRKAADPPAYTSAADQQASALISISHALLAQPVPERILSAEQLADLNERFRSHWPKS